MNNSVKVTFRPAVKVVTKAEIIKACFDRYGKHLSQLHHDFLALPSQKGTYFEHPSYFFYLTNLAGIVEVRFWKTSKRVSTTRKFTHRS